MQQNRLFVQMELHSEELDQRVRVLICMKDGAQPGELSFGTTETHLAVCQILEDVFARFSNPLALLTPSRHFSR